MLNRLKFLWTELFVFALKQAQASIFAGVFLFILIFSKYFTFGLYRYDFIFLCAVLTQIGLIYFKLETKDEAKTIFLFHIIGLALELYKTSSFVGSWSYPELSYLKIYSVPLYSGFMYAAVGSYIAGSWKIMRLRFTAYPKLFYTYILGFLIYLNFFTNHYFYDIRYILFLGLATLFFRTKVYFTVRAREYSMPLLFAFFLIAFFVWVAENIGTLTGAWLYPNQVVSWNVVHLQKITSWTLMVIICFLVVASLKFYKQKVT
jgi:uncharacterized membrane protein YoaT (DUF817 family)